MGSEGGKTPRAAWQDVRAAGPIAEKLAAMAAMTGILAHDLNNELTVVKGYCDLLQRQAIDESVRPMVDEIKAAGERMIGLMEQFLAFSRTAAAEARTVDLNTVLADLQPRLERFTGTAVSLVVELAGEPCEVFVNVDRLRRAVIHLVTNAWEALSPGGTITIRTACVTLDDAPAGVCPVRPGRYVLLTVADAGKGMDRAAVDRAFEPLFTTKPNGPGVGMGLPDVYGFIRQSGGTAGIDSTAGEGTTVRVYLPHAGTAAAAPGAGS